MQTAIFLQSLKKIEAPPSLRQKGDNVDWSKIGELITDFVVAKDDRPTFLAGKRVLNGKLLAAAIAMAGKIGGSNCVTKMQVVPKFLR